jgi:pantothenate synthetase
VKTGEQSPAVYLDAAKSYLLNDAPNDFSIDYLELVDSTTLQPIAKLTSSATLATACFYGPVRLIDHLEIVPTQS